MATIAQPVTRNPTLQDRIADVITSFCGDMRFVYLHAAAFAVWIVTKGFGTDDFPFNFLTMTVSIEAIFLSTFILISQNRQQAASEAHNEMIQQALIKMVRDVIDDEKLDQANESMISELLKRIDVEHVRPIETRLVQVSECLARVEARLSGSAPQA